MPEFVKIHTCFCGDFVHACLVSVTLWGCERCDACTRLSAAWVERWCGPVIVLEFVGRGVGSVFLVMSAILPRAVFRDQA